MPTTIIIGTRYELGWNAVTYCSFLVAGCDTRDGRRRFDHNSYLCHQYTFTFAWEAITLKKEVSKVGHVNPHP